MRSDSEAMMRFWIFIGIFLISALGSAKSEVRHEVKGKETAWFVSRLYYGTGLRYPEILQVNGMSSPEEVRPGVSLVIINPKFLPQHPHFHNRYKRLAEKRDAILNEVPPSVFGLQKSKDKSPTGRALEELGFKKTGNSQRVRFD